MNDNCDGGTGGAESDLQHAQRRHACTHTHTLQEISYSPTVIEPFQIVDNNKAIPVFSSLLDIGISISEDVERYKNIMTDTAEQCFTNSHFVNSSIASEHNEGLRPRHASPRPPPHTPNNNLRSASSSTPLQQNSIDILHHLNEVVTELEQRRADSTTAPTTIQSSPSRDEDDMSSNDCSIGISGAPSCGCILTVSSPDNSVEVELHPPNDLTSARANQEGVAKNDSRLAPVEVITEVRRRLHQLQQEL